MNRGGRMSREDRLCIVCLSIIDGAHKLYCERDRLEARRRSWRQSKRRAHGLKGVVRAA